MMDDLAEGLLRPLVMMAAGRDRYWSAGQLAMDLRMNCGTVREALGVLVERGLVTRTERGNAHRFMLLAAGRRLAQRSAMYAQLERAAAWRDLASALGYPITAGAR